MKQECVVNSIKTDLKTIIPTVVVIITVLVTLTHIGGIISVFSASVVALMVSVGIIIMGDALYIDVCRSKQGIYKNDLVPMLVPLILYVFGSFVMFALADAILSGSFKDPVLFLAIIFVVNTIAVFSGMVVVRVYARCGECGGSLAVKLIP